MMKKAAADSKAKGKKPDLHVASLVNSCQGKDVGVYSDYYAHQHTLALDVIQGLVFNLAEVNTAPCMC